MSTLSVESLPVVTFNSIPVITTELLANLYGTKPDYIRKNHNRNYGRFLNGKHYFLVEGQQLRDFKHSMSLRPSVKIAINARSLTLWTERGAARHAKILETDQAWEVFERLEDHYFSQSTERPSTTSERTPLRQQAENLVAKAGAIYPDIWRLIHNHFGVEHIRELTPYQVKEAISYLREIEGEFISRDRSQALIIDCHTDSCEKLRLRDMMNNGWDLQINQILTTLQHAAKSGATVQVKNIGRAKEEFNSLCEMVELLSNEMEVKFKSIKRALTCVPL